MDYKNKAGEGKMSDTKQANEAHHGVASPSHSKGEKFSSGEQRLNERTKEVDAEIEKLRSERKAEDAKLLSAKAAGETDEAKKEREYKAETDRIATLSLGEKETYLKELTEEENQRAIVRRERANLGLDDNVDQDIK